jgi:hypothetical protein
MHTWRGSGAARHSEISTVMMARRHEIGNDLLFDVGERQGQR